MLQCAIPSLLPGELIHITSTSDPDFMVTVDCYSLLSPSASSHSNLKKFGVNTVHVNTDDHITLQQIQRLRNALHEFSFL